MKNLDLSQLSILIVENHDHMRVMFKEIFRTFGIKKNYALATPESGYEAFSKGGSDLVLIDWAPDFDGIGLLNKIRTDSNSANPFVPVIMVTAYSDVDRVVEARDAGMTEYLNKPVSAKRLYQRITSIVESERPYVRVSKFFGPDRRPKKKGITGDERRESARDSDDEANKMKSGKDSEHKE